MFATVALVDRADFDVDVDVTRHERHWDCTEVCMSISRTYIRVCTVYYAWRQDNRCKCLDRIVRILQLVSQSWPQPRFQLLLLVLAFMIHLSFRKAANWVPKRDSPTILVYLRPGVCTP